MWLRDLFVVRMRKLWDLISSLQFICRNWALLALTAYLLLAFSVTSAA